MSQPACEAFAVQAALDLWADRGFAAMSPIRFLDTLGSDLHPPAAASPTAVRLLADLREQIAARYLADLGREPEEAEWEAIYRQAEPPVLAAAVRQQGARIRTKFWQLCELFMTPADFGTFWATGRLPRPFGSPLDEGLPANRLKMLQELEAVHLQLLERPPTDAELAAILDPADQLFPLPDGTQLPKPAAAAFFPDLAAAFGGNLGRRELLQFATARTLPPAFDPTPDQLGAATMRLNRLTATLTNLRQAPPVLKDWLALHQLTWPPKNPKAARPKPPAADRFPLPDGVTISRPLAAAFFPNLCHACNGHPPRKELLALAILGLNPENTDDLAEDLVETIAEALADMTDTITAARGTPPVPEDWQALYDLTWPPAKP